MHQTVKTGNASDRLLKEVKQIFWFNVSSEKIAKNIYNTIIKSIKKKKNSESSNTSHPHSLLLNLTDIIDLQRGEKGIAL